jgi:hypothetical protein
MTGFLTLPFRRVLAVAVGVSATWAPVRGQALDGPSAAQYRTLQEAVDQNAGRAIFVPAGDYVLASTLKLTTDHSGLWGPGRIIQSNPAAAIVEIAGAHDVQLQDLTLTRPEGKMETHQPGIFVHEGGDVRIENVQVIDNRGDLASIYVRSCIGVRIKNCLVENYSRISIDDRRRRPDVPNFDVIGGYSFNTISGTGIGVRACGAVLIQGNRVIERVMIPTPELKEKYQLGSFAARDAQKGSGLAQAMWDSGYNNGWHQGSAIALANVGTDPFVQTNPFLPREVDPVAADGTDTCFQVIANYIENAAQGMDVHVDQAVIAYNIVNNSFMGMKAVHGARNVLIIGNQFSRNDLWAILLMPGTTSHVAHAATGGKAAEPANIDGYSIVANNIISDFGYGHAHWNWAQADPTPLVLNSQRALATVPPLRDVIVQGNIIYDTGRDQILVDGKPRLEPPRYHYAVKLATGPGAPENIQFADNLFHPGTEGVSNVPLPSAELSPIGRAAVEAAQRSPGTAMSQPPAGGR